MPAAGTYVASKLLEYAARTSMEIEKPAGSKEGDILLIFPFVEVNGKAITVTGATEITPQKQVGTAWRQGAFWLKHDGTAAKIKITWASSENKGSVVAVDAWRGLNQTTPIDATGTLIEYTGKTWTSPTLTTLTDNAVQIIMEVNGAGTLRNKTPTGFALETDYSPFTISRTKATAGATGTTECELQATASPLLSMTFALRPAPEAPTVTSEAASSIGKTEATANGKVNPNAAATTWWYEYGTSEALGSKTAEEAAGEGSTAVAKPKAITGLTAATKYFFRLVAKNSVGESKGTILNFTTAGEPPTVTTEAATSVGKTEANLNGKVDPENQPTTFWFEWGPTEGFGSKSTEESAGEGTTPVAKSWHVGVGLSAGTKYFFRLVAKNAAGTTNGTTLNFTTEAEAAKPTVTTKAATVLGPNIAVLKGEVDPEGQATNYWFEYGTTEALGTKTAEESAGSESTPLAKSKEVLTLTAATKYFFRIVAKNATGESKGTILNFTTGEEEKEGPAVETKAATGVGPRSAQLNGMLDPGVPPTALWWFEWGTTEALGNSTEVQSLTSATFDPVSQALTGLAGHTKYFYRLAGENSAFPAARGAILNFTTEEEVLTSLDPSTELAISLLNPDGSVGARWGADEQAVGDIPKGLSFTTEDPNGFKNCTLALARRIDQQWPDLYLYRPIHVYGEGGRTAWDGRLQELPGHHAEDYAISPGAVGHVAELDDDPSFAEIYGDIDLTRWAEASITRQQLLNSLAYYPEGSFGSTFQDSGGAGTSGLMNNMSGVNHTGAGVIMGHELWYYGNGVDLGRLAFDFIGDGTTTWLEYAFLANTDAATNEQIGSFNGTTAEGQEVKAAAAGRKYAAFQSYYNGAFVGLMTNQHRFQHVLVMGRHGLTLRGTWPNVGLYASDVIADIVNRCSNLTFTTGPEGSIRDSTYAIPHLVVGGKGSDAILAVNAYHQRSWFVWEDKRFYWRPQNAYRKRWRIRRSKGHGVDLLGPQVEDSMNGVVATFTDAAGISRTIGPPGCPGAYATSELLGDTSPTNPVNRAGIERKWGELSIGFVTNLTGAIQVAAAWMQEKLANANSRGSVVVPGLVADDKTGALYPSWYMRAGDSAVVTDGDNIERGIISTSYDHDSRTCTCNLDSTPHKVDALMERMGLALVGVTE